jgi:superfamily II DNA or RNA helicase
MVIRKTKGVYDALIDETIREVIKKSGLPSVEIPLDIERMPKVLSDYLRTALRAKLAAAPAHDRERVAEEVTNGVFKLLEMDEPTKVEFPANLLKSLGSINPDGSADHFEQPTIPLSESALITNSSSEPSVGSEITRELASSDKVDVLMAFVRFSGIRPHLDAFKAVIDRGGEVRIATTTYTGSTEPRALDELEKIGAKVKVSYDVRSTRLHAKAWLFERKSGYSTALIGSSNLTYSASNPGLEWNVRLSQVENISLINKFAASFESYWNDESFESYEALRFAKSIKSSQSTNGIDITPFDIRPFPFQTRMLEQLSVERESFDRHSNLVVSATGTGKTVMAALDYKRLQSGLKNKKLLFVAHRREILKQSLSTFRHVLRNGSFGELWVDGHIPNDWDAVFASVQTLNLRDLDKIQPDHFGMIIIDEFHHAGAASYEKILEYFQPEELVGLTATPERTDGRDILKWFGGKCAVELRLWDALEQDLLVPFHYFAIHDGTVLKDLHWKRGAYLVAELENIYTADDFRVTKILEAIRSKVTDTTVMKAVAFCVSKAHAIFMAKKFNAVGIASTALISGQTNTERDSALSGLRNGEIQCVFAVDILNEGVDLPSIDTVLFLRPTESATLFLQQLGRGLRKAANKDVLTVLDFVGHHKKEFRFDQRLRKLIGGSRTGLIDQIEKGFPFLPAGCHINLDRVSQNIILDSVKNSLPTTIGERVSELVNLGDVSLSEYLQETGLELEDVYRSGHWWSKIRRSAGFEKMDANPIADKIGRSMGKQLHPDDLKRLDAWTKLLSRKKAPKFEDLDEVDSLYAYMLVSLIWGWRSNVTAEASLVELWGSTAEKSELIELLDILKNRVSHLTPPIAEGLNLSLHGRYSTNEVLAAFGLGFPETIPSFREGVKWIESHQTDIFFITLDKSEKEFAPSVRYHDYAISPFLFHWESQSTTGQASPTGQRYLGQSTNGNKIMLFVREKKKSELGAQPYMCLGYADFVKAKGDKPIAITYRLKVPMPGDLFSEARVIAN